MAILYRATNLVNGKRYIGITRYDLNYRKGRHLYLASIGDKGCPRFYDAIRKYGPDNFEWEELQSFDRLEEAQMAEIAAIAEAKPEYNVSRGGSLGPAESRNRMRVICLSDGKMFDSITEAAAHYGSALSEIAKSCKKPGTTAGGRYFAYFTKEMTAHDREAAIRTIVAERAKYRSFLRRGTAPRKGTFGGVHDGRDSTGRSASGPMSNARPVRCIDDGKVFPSASAAARYYDVARSALIELCLGKNGRKTVGARRFEYAG